MGRRRKFSFTGNSLERQVAIDGVPCLQLKRVLPCHFTELQLSITVGIENVQLEESRPECEGERLAFDLQSYRCIR